MKPRAVLILAGLVAALAAFIWLVERDLPSSEELAERAKKVLAVESDEVSAIELEWAGETVRLERAPAPGAGPEEGAEEDETEEEPAAAGPSPEWRLVEPVAARADRAAVDGLLTSLTGLDKRRTIEDAERSEVGLDPPRGRVTLVTPDGERTLEIGAEVPASENVLVALAGEPEVWVTPRSFVAQLERRPGEWRSREVMAVTRDGIARVVLRRAGVAEAVALVRGDGDRFRLAEPFADLADSDRVDELLADLVTLRAQRFLDEPGEESPAPAALGLEPPRAVIEVHLEAGRGEPIRVELGAPVREAEAAPAAPGTAAGEQPAGAVYARVGGQLFEAETGLGEAAARPAGEWRSPAWTGLRSYEVDRVAVTGAGEPELTLEREGVDWRRGEETVPYTVVSDLLFALTEAAGELAEAGGAAAAAAASAEPTLTVRLATEAGEEETLTLYAERDGRFPARSSARESTLLLPAAEVAELRDAVAAARTAEPVAED
ncbi:MAG TPA: DUF4340 domain-containing protein [Thermoanaerobaculia bacterium]|nr:DUF4340 domain-containing protein [Thermoanaerobaculia bacterium]